MNLNSEKLLNCDGALVPTERAFKNKNLIAFFFSAAWSAECMTFLPLLRQIYQVHHRLKSLD